MFFGRNRQKSVSTETLATLMDASVKIKGDFYFDSHGKSVADGVWQTFAEVMRKDATIPALIEWDNNLPTLDVLLAEAAKAETIRLDYTGLTQG